MTKNDDQKNVKWPENLKTNGWVGGSLSCSIDCLQH
jgi:hypothetical protein